MQKLTRDEYLAQEIGAASPQKLQLLLIEAAIRQGQKAKQFWSKSDHERAGDAIIRAQEIVSHLLGDMKIESGPPLVRRVAAVYTFLVRRLTNAHLQRDEQALNDVLRILEIERETWRQVCQAMTTSSGPSAPVAPHFALPANGAANEQASQFSWHA